MSTTFVMFTPSEGKVLDGIEIRVAKRIFKNTFTRRGGVRFQGRLRGEAASGINFPTALRTRRQGQCFGSRLFVCTFLQQIQGCRCLYKQDAGSLRNSSEYPNKSR